MPHMAFWAWAGCLDAPGKEGEQEERMPAARLNADLEHTVGAVREPLLTDCSHPDLHFLIFPSLLAAPFNPKS